MDGFSPGIQGLNRLRQEEDCNSRPSFSPLKKDGLQDSVLLLSRGSWSSNPVGQPWQQHPCPLYLLLQALNSSFWVDSVGGEKYMGVIDHWHRVTHKTYKIPKT